jgi:hypothetical protein
MIVIDALPSGAVPHTDTQFPLSSCREQSGENVPTSPKVRKASVVSSAKADVVMKSVNKNSTSFMGLSLGQRGSAELRNT